MGGHGGMDPETGTIVGSPLTQWKTKILWIFAPAKHRIKARGGRAAVSSVCSFICLSAVILHNYTLSNQKDARGREGSEQPARLLAGQERRGEWPIPSRSVVSDSLGPLDDRAAAAFVPSFLSDRLVVLLKWARCKNMRCILLHLGVLFPLEFRVTSDFEVAADRQMSLTFCSTVEDRSSRLPVERFLLRKALIYIAPDFSSG